VYNNNTAIWPVLVSIITSVPVLAVWQHHDGGGRPDPGDWDLHPSTAAGGWLYVCLLVVCLKLIVKQVVFTHDHSFLRESIDVNK